MWIKSKMAGLIVEQRNGTCCLCLAEDESTFHSNSVMKSLPLHEMVKYCIGIQINTQSEEDAIFSTSICNECVLNINNYYSFKKRVLEAQELINELNSSREIHSKGNAESAFVTETMLPDGEDEVFYVDSGNEMQQTDIIKPAKQSVMVTRIVQVAEGTKRPKDAVKPPRKRAKIDVNACEKIAVQINECLICPAVLDDVLQLEMHKGTHTEIKCKACNRQFARYSNLKRHFNSVHSKPKPFQCDMCGLGFNFSVNLTAHAIHCSSQSQS